MILNKKSVLASLAFAAVVSSVGCSGSGGGGAKPTEDVTGDDVSQYTTASCKYKYAEGPAYSVRGSDNIQTSYFDKKINLALLKPVLGAAGSEVVAFAQTTGVKYYKTDAHKKSDSCEFAAELPAAPWDIQKLFDKEDSNDTLGVYLPLNSKNYPSTNAIAAITVRRDANKWVLVHEFMHHLFDKESKGEKSGDEVKASIQSLLKDYQAQIDKSRNADSYADKRHYLELAAYSLIDLNKDVVTLLKHFYLEEMTIESILSSKLESGELSLVVKGQRLNGAAYTISSAKKSSELIDAFQGEISTFLASYSSYTKDSQYAALNEAKRKYTAIEDQMTTLKAKANSVLKAEGLNYTGLRLVDMATQQEVEQEPAGCSHSKEADEILVQVRNLGLDQ